MHQGIVAPEPVLPVAVDPGDRRIVLVVVPGPAAAAVPEPAAAVIAVKAIADPLVRVRGQRLVVQVAVPNVV